MSARTKARKRALDVLYGSELRGLPLDGTLQQLVDDRVRDGEPPPNPYTVRLVRGVVEHQARIDALLEAYATDWSLARMPAIDRNLLRIGVYEVLVDASVPDEAAISEAVHLARELSTEQSPSFVNGVLARIAEHGPALSG